MVAAWHENHKVAVRAVEKHLRAGWTPVIPATVLLEAFAVLTRLPAPFRVKPGIARAALDAALPDSAIDLTRRDCLLAMEAVERMSLAGGKVYDAAIAQCASRSGAEALLTFDAGDYARVRPAGLEIVVPR
jgi:predicted nucleic acid-binding protein